MKQKPTGKKGKDMPKRILQGTVTFLLLIKLSQYWLNAVKNTRYWAKIVRKSKKFTAHDEANKFQKGDTVRIQECRPISKTKTWEVILDESIR